MINTKTFYFLTASIVLFASTNIVFLRFLFFLAFLFEAALLYLPLLFCIFLYLLFNIPVKGCISEDF